MCKILYEVTGMVGKIVAVTLLACAGASLGQATGAVNSTTGAAYVPTMTFDVASVRENKAADLRVGIMMSGQFTPTQRICA